MDFDWEFNAPHWCDFTKEINDNNADFWFETPGSVSPMTKKMGVRTPIRQKNSIMNTPHAKKIGYAPSPKQIKEDPAVKSSQKVVTIVNTKPQNVKQATPSSGQKRHNRNPYELTPLMKFRTILPW